MGVKDEELKNSIQKSIHTRPSKGVCALGWISMETTHGSYLSVVVDLRLLLDVRIELWDV